MSKIMRLRELSEVPKEITRKRISTLRGSSIQSEVDGDEQGKVYLQIICRQNE